MTVSGPSKLSFLHSSGNNGRLVKYIFTWTEKKQQLILQFQMGVVKCLYINGFNVLPQVYHKSQVLNKFIHHISCFFSSSLAHRYKHPKLY